MINGKARHSQSQASVENMLACWQVDNNTTNWASGLQFVQYAKNARYHKGIGRSPFMAQLGYEAKLGTQTLNLDKDILENVTTEEQLNSLMNGSEPEDDEQTNADNVENVESEDRNEQLNKSLNNNELDDAEFVIEEDVYEEVDREFAMAMGENRNITEEAVETDDHPSNSMNIGSCVSCGENFSPQSIFSARSCSSCQGFSHASCIKDDILCQLCKKQAQIIAQRQGAKRKQQDQADKMLERSTKRFKEAQVGDTVLVPIPDLDRGRCEYPNLKAIILEMHPNGSMWRLGCKSGVLDQWYSRNQFQPTLEKFMNVEDVDIEKEVSLRAAARAESIGGGQGYFRCNCTGNCKTKRCKCYKDNLKCNSRCHNQRSCCNKD